MKISESIKENTLKKSWYSIGSFFTGSVADLKAKLFSISYIKTLKTFIFLVWKACYTSILKGVTLIIEISIVGSLTNFFCGLKRVDRA